MLTKVREGHIISTLVILLLVTTLGLLRIEVSEFRHFVTGPLYRFIEAIKLGGILCIVISVALLLGQAILMVTVLNQNKIFSKNSFLFVIIYMLIGIQGINQEQVSMHLYLLSFIPMIYYQFIELYRSEFPAYERVFNLGLILGLMSVVELMYGIFFIVLIYPLLRAKTTDLRFWLLYLVGFIVPVYTYLGLVFLLKGEGYFELMLPTFIEGVSGLTQEDYILYGCLVLFLTFAIYSLQSRFARLIVLKRKVHLLNFTMLGLGAIMLILSQHYKSSIIFFILIPASILITDMFNRMEKKWVYEILWICFLAIAIL